MVASEHLPTYDCMVVGGGPAGLMAATYLGRFRRRVIVFDSGVSRAKWIPSTRNCPGFPDGITGEHLLQRLTEQAVQYGAILAKDTVHNIRLAGTDFIANASLVIRARSVLIATGIVDTLPQVPGADAMIKAGALRLCPICDGYEVIGKRIAVLGPATAALEKALFMRTYSPHVTMLVTDTASALDRDARTSLAEAGIEVELCIPGSIRTEGEQASVGLNDGRVLSFDTVYPAMGCTKRTELALDLGAASDAAGDLIVDTHQRTGIPGLYAAGDIVNELNQIAVAFGHAAIASSDMHNYLTKRGAR